MFEVTKPSARTVMRNRVQKSNEEPHRENPVGWRVFSGERIDRLSWSISRVGQSVVLAENLIDRVTEGWVLVFDQVFQAGIEVEIVDSAQQLD